MVSLLGAAAVECSLPDDSARVAVCLPDGSPPGPAVVATTAEATVLFSGYLRDLPPGCPGEAEYVLSRYRAEDWSWLRHASGVFAFAVVDRGRDRCVLGADRLGIRPLLFAADDSGMAFAADLGVVAAWRRAAREIDHEALQELIAIGFPLGERTALRGVERVPPGSWVEFGLGRHRVNRYWSVHDLPPPRPQDPDAFLDESHHHLRHAIIRLAERSRGSPLCLLSSGYDSRRLLLEGHTAGIPFETMTAVWPYRRLARASIDPPVVGELCRRVDVPNKMVRLPETGEWTVLQRDRGARDTLLDFQVKGNDHIWAMPLVAALPTTARVWNFDGMAGDTFFNNPFFTLPRAVWGRWRVDDEILEGIVPAHRSWDQLWRGRPERSLAARIHDALNALPEGPNRLSLFYLLGRTRRVAALLPYGLLDLKIDSVCPYVDADVMEHAWTFDPIGKAELRMQRRALDRHFPGFADLPSSHSSAAEIPARYVVEADIADPDEPRPFTPPDVLRLLGARIQRSVPFVASKDVAVAALDAVRLGRLGGGWREARIRQTLYAFAAADWLGRSGSELLRGRIRSLQWLAQRLPSGGLAEANPAQLPAGFSTSCSGRDPGAREPAL
jgi:Glutamine amidotransferase domain